MAKKARKVFDMGRKKCYIVCKKMAVRKNSIEGKAVREGTVGASACALSVSAPLLSCPAEAM